MVKIYNGTTSGPSHSHPGILVKDAQDVHRRSKVAFSQGHTFETKTGEADTLASSGVSQVSLLLITPRARVLIASNTKDARHHASTILGPKYPHEAQ
ncbi:hypothetical protein OF83DRAFT_688435 [Amylostereum chailletii]|nr:hypothetical protein OF83DRAFT_688435 [Amylostereum chailletii]